jgi:hypothetical protein
MAGQVADQGYDVVINLAPPQSHGSLRRTRGGIVGSKGVVYLHIRWIRKPRRGFRLFTEMMKARAGKKVFVHCQVKPARIVVRLPLRVIHEWRPVGRPRSS